MSYTSSNFYEDYVFMEKLKTPSVWYNPAEEWTKSAEGTPIRPKTIYIGEHQGKPTWEEPIFDVSRYMEAKNLLKQGKINEDKAQYSHWLSSQWENAAVSYADYLKYGKSYTNSPFRQASGVVTSQDSPTINVVQILGEVMGRTEKNYTMEDAVTRIATPNLNIAVDTWKGFVASADIPEYGDTPVRKGGFTREQYFLKKDAAHILVTDEAQARSDRNVFTIHVNHAVQDLRRLKAQKIAIELETAANESGGADWAAHTAGVSTTDPIRQIATVADIIELNGGTPNTIASHGRAFRDFAGNSRVNGQGQVTPEARFGTTVVGNLPGLPGFTWYVDNLKTAGLVTIYDKSAVLLMQGPVRTAQYRNELKGADGYITRDYNAVKIIDTSRIRDLPAIGS